MNSLEQLIQTKNNKNIIMRLFDNTTWCGRTMIEKDKFIFWIENDKKCKQFQIVFCEDCGNYIYQCENDTLLCSCNI
jgi:hypothetical protein